MRSIVNAEEPDVRLQYDRAFSPWPGRVYVRGLVLTGQDMGTQWQIKLDRAAATIAVHQLARRVFHVTWVRAEGGSFALRLRLIRERSTPERLKGVPMIDRLGPLALREEGPADAPVEMLYDKFTVWIGSWFRDQQARLEPARRLGELPRARRKLPARRAPPVFAPR